MKQIRRHLWTCLECGAENHVMDAECQFCDAHECYVRGEDWRDDGPNYCVRCGKELPSDSDVVAAVSPGGAQK